MPYQGVALFFALGIGIAAAAFLLFYEQGQEGQRQEQPHRSTRYSDNTPNSWTRPSEHSKSTTNRRKRNGKSQSGSAPICAICQDAMLVERDSKMLACSHRFHFKCINSWAQISTECPCCRRSMS